MIEQEVRFQINQSLQAKGWVLDPSSRDQNVYFETAVYPKLNKIQKKRLGQKSPDYTFFNGHQPVAILEAKKSRIMNLDDAFDQAGEYAENMDVEMIFASNGSMFKSRHLKTQKPLILNGLEVNEPLSPNDLRRFQIEKHHSVATINQEIIASRRQLISVFSDLNDDLRAAGIRAGIERFSEFSNILFLKLLSELGDSECWDSMLIIPEDGLLKYFNEVIVDKLGNKYGGEVLSKTSIEDASILQKIILQLQSLSLSSVDEDIKGVAFEHFIQKTTDTQNDLGEYFTPRHIIRFMVELLNPKFGKKVYDPFCGTGGFLTETFKHLSRQVNHSTRAYEILHNKSIYGGEITATARVAKMNMILFGDGHSGVFKQNSLKTDSSEKYDYVLSNIPFSQKIPKETLNLFEGLARNGDEACIMRCFKSLKRGGSMAIVVPEGFIYNNAHSNLRRHLFQNSSVHLIAHLPSGCFAPYTLARTAIMFLTDKDIGTTDSFFRARVGNDGYSLDSARTRLTGPSDLDDLSFFFSSLKEKDVDLSQYPNVTTVSVNNLDSATKFYLSEEWVKSSENTYVELQEVAYLKNGKTITQADTTFGSIPVIAGGGGSSPYTHGESNYDGNVITVSKSGAYSGYVWWHDEPIWASDSIAIQSKDEGKYMNLYLYLCMKAKQEEIYLRQQGTAQPHVYIKHMRDFPIPALSLEKQYEIVKKYQSAQQDLKKAEQRINKTEHAINKLISSMYSCNPKK